MITHKQHAILTDPNTFATTMLGLAAKTLGAELLTWDPETVAMEMHEVIGHELPDENKNRLFAAIDIVTSDAFYKDLASFIRICNILAHGTFEADTFDPADANEIALGITEAILLWPPDPNDPKPFSDEIVGYIGQVISSEGLLAPPDVLQIGVPGMTTNLAQAQEAFANDPDMLGAIIEIEHERSDAINQAVKDRLRELVEQMDNADLLKDKNAAETMLNMLQKHRAQDEKLTPTNAET